jgi:hypothetical protein
LDPQALKTLNLILGAVFGFFSFISLLGGVAILRRRFFSVAVAGSILAILNISDCCCVLGAPVGIACLFLLFQPHVKASFQSPPGS